MYVIGINDFKVRWLAPSLQNANVTLSITYNKKSIITVNSIS